jgi:cell division transport system permease protein
MLLDFALPEHDRKLMPEGRLSGPMPWVIAIMLFLTCLAAAAALIMADAANRGGQDLAQQATVQVIETDPARRASQRDVVAKILRADPKIKSVTIVPDSDVRQLLKPWIGTEVIDTDIPIPALIDIRYAKSPTANDLSQLQSKFTRSSPNVKLNSHASWMAPFFALMRALIWLMMGILLLLLIATSFTVVLAVRSALNTHRETIEIMHMMGGTDLQAARLFQRRVALDALLGGGLGFGAAVLVIFSVSSRFTQIEPGMMGQAAMPLYGWIVLALIPIAIMGLAMLMARWTVLSALKKIL